MFITVGDVYTFWHPQFFRFPAFDRSLTVFTQGMWQPVASRWRLPWSLSLRKQSDVDIVFFDFARLQFLGRQ